MDEDIVYLARTVLTRQVRKLSRMEPQFRETVPRAAYDNAALSTAMQTGWLLFGQALSNARAALSSGDPAKIVWAAIRNSELITSGLASNVRHRSKEIARTAGKAGGEKRAAKIQATDKDELGRWNELQAKHGRNARGIHLKELAAKGVVISERHHRNRYPVQNEPETN